VYKHVVAAFIRRDEAEATFLIEELNCACETFFFDLHWLTRRTISAAAETTAAAWTITTAAIAAATVSTAAAVAITATTIAAATAAAVSTAAAVTITATTIAAATAAAVSTAAAVAITATTIAAATAATVSTAAAVTIATATVAAATATAIAAFTIFGASEVTRSWIIKWIGERTTAEIVVAKLSAATPFRAAPTTTVTPAARFVVVKTHICMLSSLAKSGFPVLFCTSHFHLRANLFLP
jgi:phosphatidylglycerophosphatase A